MTISKVVKVVTSNRGRGAEKVSVLGITSVFLGGQLGCPVGSGWING